MRELSTRLGAVRVRWLGGGLLVDGPGGAVLVDAGVAAVTALVSDPAVTRLTTVVLSSDRARCVVGLPALLASLDAAGVETVQLVHPITAERGVALAQAWMSAWPGWTGVQPDAVVPGGRADCAAGEVEVHPLTVGEPRWRTGEVVPVAGCGVVVDVAGVRVAWLPSARAGVAPRRVVGSADLAVIEVASAGFPPSAHPWRRTVTEALAVGAGAHQVWLVGDDGAPVAPDEEQ